MPRQLNSYDILIASPSDTTVERDIVSECIRDWNSAHETQGVQCRDVRWELDAVPEYGERSQEVLNKQLVDGADILIGIFKSRIGMPTGVTRSGTVEEIERFVAARKPVMLYFSTGAVPRDHDPKQLQLLIEYERQVTPMAIYKPFTDEHDLRRKVMHGLSKTMARIQDAPQSIQPRNSLILGKRKNAATALDDVQATYTIVNEKYNLLRAACQTDAQRDALAAQYADAQTAYFVCVGQMLSADDVEIATLSQQLQAANTLVKRSVMEMGDMSKVIDQITEAVTLGAKLITAAGL